MGFLSDTLGTLGDVFGAPKRLLYQHVLSPLLGQQVDNFHDILTKGLGWDADDFGGKALGFVGDLATDPLTYLGGLGGLGGRAAAFGKAAGLGKAGGEAAGLLANPAMKAVAEEVPVVWGAKLGQGAAPGLTELPGSARAAYSVASAPGESGLSLLGETTAGGARSGSMAMEAKANSLRDLFEGAPQLTSQMDAAYDPTIKTIFSTGARPQLAGNTLAEGAAGSLSKLRHERFHSLVHAGMENPQAASQLPFLARTSARLQSSPNSLKQGLGAVLDELGGHAVESRSTLGQLRNAGRFLFNPEVNALYQGQIAARSPLVAKLYGLLPSSLPAGGAALGHSLSGLGE